jgi:hypothetical protein
MQQQSKPRKKAKPLTPPERSGCFPSSPQIFQTRFADNRLCHGAGCSSWRSQMDLTTQTAELRYQKIAPEGDG